MMVAGICWRRVPVMPQFHRGYLGSRAVVEVEGARQSGTRFDDAGDVVVVGRSNILGQKVATHSLVVPLGVVAADVFANKMSQVCLAKVMK